METKDDSKMVVPWECTSRKMLYGRWMMMEDEGRGKDEVMRELQKEFRGLG